MTPQQKTALATAAIIFVVAVLKVFGFDIPLAPVV